MMQSRRLRIFKMLVAVTVMLSAASLSADTAGTTEFGTFGFYHLHPDSATTAQMNHAIFVEDSLEAEIERRDGLLALEQEGRLVLSDSFWRNWKVWGPIAVVGFGLGYYTASR